MSSILEELRVVAYLILVTVDCGISERIQLLLGLTHQSIQTRFHIGQFVTDMIHQDLSGRFKRLTQFKNWMQT